MRPTQPHASVRSRSLGAALSLLFVLAISGCGYHAAGSATHIPAGVRTIAVPVFATHAQAYHTEMTLTSAVIRELDTRTRLRVVTSGDPDATLTGTILSQTSVPLTYDSTTGETSSYLITVTARAMLTARDGHILYQNNALTFREQYQSTQDLSGFIREDTPAVQRLSRNFARALVSDMLESF